MQFIDLKTQYKTIKADILNRIDTVLEHGQYIMGPEIDELEKTLASYVDVKHAISCSSGTDALLLGLMAKGIRAGDAIFTTPFTFIATSEVIALLGATPVLIDIDPETFNIDPSKLEAAIADFNQPSLHPKGIIAVDLFGLPADYDRINAIAKKYGLFVIEDAAQSFGAQYKGKMACSLADIACTSFFPAKPLGGYGDGGMCFTNDDGIAEKMISLRIHGQGKNKYDNARIGINGRLDTLQAAVLLSKFTLFPDEIGYRNQHADNYRDLLASAEHELRLPIIPDGYLSAWAQYSILAKDSNHRDTIQKALSAAGIPSAIYYPKPLHQQSAFKYLNYKRGDFPVSEDCSDRIFSIPMHPYLEYDDQKRIADTIKSHNV